MYFGQKRRFKLNIIWTCIWGNVLVAGQYLKRQKVRTFLHISCWSPKFMFMFSAMLTKDKESRPFDQDIFEWNSLVLSAVSKVSSFLYFIISQQYVLLQCYVKLVSQAQASTTARSKGSATMGTFLCTFVLNLFHTCMYDTTGTSQLQSECPWMCTLECLFRGPKEKTWKDREQKLFFLPPLRTKCLCDIPACY